MTHVIPGDITEISLFLLEYKNTKNYLFGKKVIYGFLLQSWCHLSDDVYNHVFLKHKKFQESPNSPSKNHKSPCKLWTTIVVFNNNSMHEV